MSTPNPIAVRGVAEVKVEIQQDAYSTRATVISASKFAPDAITGPEENQWATDALRDVKRLLKQVEDGRKLAKAPALDLGRKIDAAAEEFCQPLIVEEKRLTGLLTSYQAEQQRIAREAEQKRQAELARQQEEERKKREEIQREIEAKAEAQRRAEQQAREATNAKARAEAENAALEAAAQRAENEARLQQQAEAANLEQAELMRAPSPAAPKAAGTAVANPWVFEVTDLKALHAARPELVDLVVRRADIITRIRQGEREIPGLRIYQDTRVTVRT